MGLWAQGLWGTDLSHQPSVVFSRRCTWVGGGTHRRFCPLFMAKQTFWEEAFFF